MSWQGGGHADDAAPVTVLHRRLMGNDDSHGRGPDVVGIGNDVVNATGQFHHAERVLESAVSCTGIQQVSKGQLMNVP